MNAEMYSTSTPAETAAQLTVRLGSLAANFRECLRRAAPASVAPVVKANAYGMGLAPVAHALVNSGADSFFVARMEEGVALRELLPRARIFVLDGIGKGRRAGAARQRSDAGSEFTGRNRRMVGIWRAATTANSMPHFTSIRA